MHSKSKKIQKESVKLFKSLGDKAAGGYAESHKKIIDRFGRYRHRSYILGRTPTAAEIKFLRTHKGY